MTEFTFLHLVNGTSTLYSLQQTAIPGEMFSADDILMEGPTPNGLRDGADWELRAAYLERHFGISAQEYLQRVDERERRLYGSDNYNVYCDYDEVVLWFEEDLFCQINFLWLRNWFAQMDLGSTAIGIVCPANEQLGTLTPQRLAVLFEERSYISWEKLQFSRAAWKAYCAPEPTAIEALLEGDFSTWPMLKVGLQNHLRRFPTVRNGLNAVEQETLTQLDEVPLPFGQLFQRVSNSPAAQQHGMGDVQFAAYLANLYDGDAPLIDIDGFTGMSGSGISEWQVSLTPAGGEVAAGKLDWLELKPIDRWLGGVHLTPDNVWRWGEEHGRLRRD